MMPANRPWYSKEPKKPLSKKGKFIFVLIAIILLALIITVAVINHRTEIAQEQQLKIEEAQKAQEVAKQAKVFIPWLENSMNEYNTIYTDMKKTWQPGNYNMASQLGPLLTRINALKNDLGENRPDIPDDSGGSLPFAYQDHLDAINELYNDIATAIKEFAGIDLVSQEELTQIDNLMDTSFSDENDAKDNKDYYLKNENDN